MARSIQNIYDSLIAEKEQMTALNALQPNMDNAQTLLSDLSTSSRVAIWRLIFFVVAFGIWTLEKLFDDHKEWIEKRAREIKVGNPYWYGQKSLEFQLGDPLVRIDGIYQYATIDESKKIVKLAAVTETGGDLLIKVATLNAGVPAPLTTPELQAFVAYMEKVKFGGVSILYISRPADLLKIYYKVYYDPQIMSSTGESLSNPGIFPVHDTINAYCQGLDFNGKFSHTELTDLIQQTAGVGTPLFQSAETKIGTSPYVPMGDFYQPFSGYLKIDPAFPLETTIEYIAQ